MALCAEEALPTWAYQPNSLQPSGGWVPGGLTRGQIRRQKCARLTGSDTCTYHTCTCASTRRMVGSGVALPPVFLFNSHVLVQFTRPSVRGMSEAAPLLFLDVDGVLHHSQASSPSEFFHPRCMANLQRIVHSTECKLVLSSFWRTDPEMVERLNAALAECDIAPVASSTRQHAPPDLSLPAKERLSLSVIRAREISDWRQQGSRREASWAVLDDLQMSAELPSNGGHPACYELEDHLVNTCPLHGMTDAHVRAAIAMLTEWEGVPAGDVMDATKLVCPLCEKEGRGPPEPVEAEPSVPLASQAGVRAGAAASVAPGSMPSHEKHAGGPSHEKHAGGAQHARTLPSTRATARGIATDVPSMLPRLEPRLSITATSAETVLARIAVQPTADLAVSAADSVLSSDGAVQCALVRWGVARGRAAREREQAAPAALSELPLASGVRPSHGLVPLGRAGGRSCSVRDRARGAGRLLGQRPPSARGDQRTYDVLPPASAIRRRNDPCGGGEMRGSNGDPDPP